MFKSFKNNISIDYNKKSYVKKIIRVYDFKS